MIGLEADKQQTVLQEVLKKSLNVKQTESLISKPVKTKPKIKKVQLKYLVILKSQSIQSIKLQN